LIYDLLLFPFFLLCLISIGQALDYLISRAISLHDGLPGDLPIKGFLGLLFVGCISLFVNFFVPVTSTIFFCLAAASIVLGGVVLVKQR